MSEEEDHDPSLDTLLDLDGQVLVVDPVGKHWVKFIVRRVPPVPERPHGLRYSLTLHDDAGARLVGFDNAHVVQPASGPGGGRRSRRDHKHRFRSVRPYDYKVRIPGQADRHSGTMPITIPG